MSVDENTDRASSADQLDATVTETTETATANSSDATPSDNGDGDLLSVVRDVVAKGETKTETPASQAETAEETVEPEPEEELSEDPSDDELARYSSKTRRRIKQLLTERNAFKNDAQLYRNVQNFIDSQGLTAEETADGLIIMGLAKTDPAEAWRRIKPFVQNLLVASGEVLPDDLKTMVQRGEISGQAALEVSRSRAAVQSTQARQQFERQQGERARRQQAAASLAQVATTWEAERRRADPNFDAKMEPLMDRVYGLQRREGVPNTPEGVRAQLEKAYRSLAAPAAPKPAAPAPRQPITPIRGGQVAGNTAGDPGGLMDIIKSRGRR